MMTKPAKNRAAEHRLSRVCKKTDEYHNSEAWLWTPTNESSNPGVATPFPVTLGK